MIRLIKFFLKPYRNLKKRIRGYYILKSVKSHQGEIYIGGPTKLSKNTTLGKNPNFNGMTIIGHGRVSFGNNFHSGSECLIITSNHNYRGNKIPYDQTHILKNVAIGDNVWFGSRVTVIGEVKIGEGAIIQAGSVVSSNIPDCAIAGGNPAQVFNYRDIDHYLELKRKGEFH